jgi:PilZ domain
MEAQAASVERTALEERRQHPRVGVSFLASLRHGAGGATECLVIDLSLGGAKVAFTEPVSLAPGEAVALEIEKFGTFRAETMWRRGVFAGLRFQEPPASIATAFKAFLPPAN